MDINTLFQQVDALFDENKAKEAEQLMLTALKDSEDNGDKGACVEILNELI
jgi:hypothetical protein